MRASLMMVAVLSIVGGWFSGPAFLPGGTDYFTKFLQPGFGGLELAGAEAEAYSLELWLAGIAFVIALGGAVVAYWVYLKRPEKADGFPESLKPAFPNLFNKDYVDELYAAGGCQRLLWICT